MNGNWLRLVSNVEVWFVVFEISAYSATDLININNFFLF